MRRLGVISGSLPSPGFGLHVRKDGWKTRATDGNLWYQKMSLLLQLPGGQIAVAPPGVVVPVPSGQGAQAA